MAPTAGPGGPPGAKPAGGGPSVSNDNPYSEAQFKTLKYRPEFPERFGFLEEARAFCQRFFVWYNTRHHHSGIGLLTPVVVHYGWSAQVLTQRHHVLAAASAAHPERFVQKPPTPPAVPTAVWINRPSHRRIWRSEIPKISAAWYHFNHPSMARRITS